MWNVIIAFVALGLIGGLWFLYVNTEDGWEDETGFHRGRKSGDK